MIPAGIREAKLTDAHGLVPEGAGWFVVNAALAQWKEHTRYGRFCAFEGPTRFRELGVNIHVLSPGQAACMYHRENKDEAFLVLHGECDLLVEDEVRRLRAWDFFHCPAGTTHVFVGAGSGPCAILMIGCRAGECRVHYPVSATAAAHGASVTVATDDPKEAYRGTGKSAPVESPWPL